MAEYDAVNSGYKWGSSNVTYTFNDLNGNVPGSVTGVTEVALFNADQQTTTNNVFAHVENLTNLSFSQVSSDANMSFITANLIDNTGYAGYAYYPSDFWGSDILIDNRYNDINESSFGEYYGLAEGNFGYALLLHEVGHALGLEHPHEGANTLSAQSDSLNSTVMSYNDSSASSVGGVAATAVGPTSNQTYQIYDIAVLQELYGANTSYNAGDNTYLFDGNTKIITIWDGNGSDTIDSTGYSGPSTIDLREGVENVTSIGNAKIWIAYNANIENATGGNNADNITGNELANILKGLGGNDYIYAKGGADWINGNSGNDYISGDAGNDTLRGGKEYDTLYGGSGDDFINGNNDSDVTYGGDGNDTVHGGKSNDQLFGDAGDDLMYGDLGDDIMTGGAGADIFIVKSNSGNDTILDFAVATDKIQLQSTSLTADSLLAATSFDADSATIIISSDASVLIQNLTPSSFSIDDFIFV